MKYRNLALPLSDLALHPLLLATNSQISQSVIRVTSHGGLEYLENYSPLVQPFFPATTILSPPRITFASPRFDWLKIVWILFKRQKIPHQALRSTLAGIEVANGGNRGRRESGDYISVEVKTLDKNVLYKILPLTKYMNASGFRTSKGPLFQLDSKMKYQINGK